MSTKLTEAIVANAAPTRKDGYREVLWDTDVSGFGVRIFPSGLKSYVLSYRSFGKKISKTLGSTEAISLKEARTLAKQEVLGRWEKRVNRLNTRVYVKGEKITVSLRMPEELKKKLAQLAKQRGHDFSEFIREGLDQWAYAHEGVK